MGKAYMNMYIKKAYVDNHICNVSHKNQKKSNKIRSF